MLKSVRLDNVVAAWLLLAAGPWLAACGGRQEVVEGPPAAKVVWSGGEGTAAPEESEADENKASEEAPAASGAAAPMEIDLDAKPGEATAASEPAESEPAADSKPARSKPAPEPEPAEEAAAEEPEISSSAPVAELQKRRQQKARAADKTKGGKGKTASKAKAASKPKSDAAGDAEPVAPAKASYSGGDACRAASFTVSRVRDACASGGRSAAKKVMKDAINKATATGQLLKCTTCHTNQVEYGLKSNAVADLKRWLEGS